MDEIIVRYLHFIGIMSFASILVMQHLILSSQVTKAVLKKIVFLDILYAVSALIILVSGLVLWLSIGKDASFYSQNWVFHVKFTLFIVVLLLSIYPTMIYRKSQRVVGDTVTLSKMVIMLVRVQLLLVFIIPFLGVLIARG